MMKTLLAAAVLAGAVAAPAGTANASERAVATTDVNLRAGPSTEYPVVDVLVAGERLRVFGCLQTRSWCDVRFRGQRGWISSNYIALTGGNYSGRQDFDPYSSPVITFSVDSYWGDHYRSRNFYGDRDRFRGHRDRDRGHRGDRGRDHDRGDYRDRDRDGGRDRDRGDHRRGRDDDRRDYGGRGDRGGWGDRDGRPGFDRDRGPDRADFDRGGRGGRGDHDRGPRRGSDTRGPGNGGPPVPLYRVD